MKKLWLLIMLLSTVTGLYAQVYGQDDDVKKEDAADGEEEIGLKRESSKDRLIVELTFDNWFHQIKELETQWYSRGFNTYLLYDIKLGKSRVSFAPGAGVGTSNIYYNVAIRQSDEGARFEVLNDSTNYDIKKNKLALAYLDVPVELRFRSKPSKTGKSFKVSLGFKAGYLLDAHTKLKVDEIGATRKYKEKNILNVNKLRYGPTFRIGYGIFNVVAYYSLAGVFNDEKGPEVTPFSIGISFNGL